MENTLKPYNDYSGYIKKRYGKRIQKISINTGFSCPNKTGEKGVGGCIYCNNNTFKPFYCEPEKSVIQQLNEGISFFKQKYKSQKYFAYFQSNTNTYAGFDVLREVYSQALSHPDVIGIIIATRPDCINHEILKLIEDLACEKDVTIELGVESTLNRTLELINRGHSYEETKNAVNLINSFGFDIGIHMILGLPGETREEIINHARKISELPITSIKLHHLQIIKGTMLEKCYLDNNSFVDVFSLESYLDLAVEFLKYLRKDIVVERFTGESPPEMIVAPNWGGVKNYHVAQKVSTSMIEKEIVQGQLYL